MSSYANAAKHSPTTSDTTNEVPRNDESQEESPSHSHAEEVSAQQVQGKGSHLEQEHEEKEEDADAENCSRRSSQDHVSQGSVYQESPNPIKEPSNYDNQNEYPQHPTNLTKQDQAEEQVMDTDTDMNSVSKDTEDVDASPDQPKDLTCEKQVVEPNQEAESKMTSLENNSPQQSYDIIKNLTEKYGNKVGAESVFETRKSNLENVLSKMSKPDEDNECEDEGDVDHEMNDEDQEKEHPGDLESEEVKDVYDFDQEQKPEYKPIKLKIARGEIVENTAIEREHAIKVEKEIIDQKSFIPTWAIQKASILKLQEKLEDDLELQTKVKDIVGEDVLNIFASAVEEAETSTEDLIENKNVVFLYYAVKNSTNLDNEDLNKNELEPLSNLALSTPLMESLWKFFIKDNNVREQIQTSLGTEDIEFFETAMKQSVEAGEEFLQDETRTPRMVKLYHSIRNLILNEAFTKLTSLYTKTEHIINGFESAEDQVYNVSVTKLKSLVTAPWNQQVIAAEAMKFEFDFINNVYTFWRRVIAKRNKPEKKPKKPLKVKPLPAMKPSDTYDIFGRPKRSTRRRNEMVTYDEDVMQECQIKSKVKGENDIPLPPYDGAEMLLP